jgi:hypothetical protein
MPNMGYELYLSLLELFQQKNMKRGLKSLKPLHYQTQAISTSLLKNQLQKLRKTSSYLGQQQSRINCKTMLDRLLKISDYRASKYGFSLVIR